MRKKYMKNLISFPWSFVFVFLFSLHFSGCNNGSPVNSLEKTSIQLAYEQMNKGKLDEAIAQLSVRNQEFSHNRDLVLALSSAYMLKANVQLKNFFNFSESIQNDSQEWQSFKKHQERRNRILKRLLSSANTSNASSNAASNQTLSQNKTSNEEKNLSNHFDFFIEFMNFIDNFTYYFEQTEKIPYLYPLENSFLEKAIEVLDSCQILTQGDYLLKSLLKLARLKHKLIYKKYFIENHSPSKSSSKVIFLLRTLISDIESITLDLQIGLGKKNSFEATLEDLKKIQSNLDQVEKDQKSLDNLQIFIDLLGDELS